MKKKILILLLIVVIAVPLIYKAWQMKRVNDYYEFMESEFEAADTTVEEQLYKFIEEDLDDLPEEEAEQIRAGVLKLIELNKTR